ncbi:MAG TPA: alpha/beta hydrolase [Hyphomonadaceae bacterium]|jgi:pimeloyl-ACP methyl ester carboxylesterase
MHTISARLLFAGVGLAALAGLQTPASAQGVTLLGVACSTPPPVHCPATACPGATITNSGNATDPKTGRNYFLDYPCDLKPNEKVTLVLNLHGGGSLGNWQRHYFPIMDFKEKYRLVVITPDAGVTPEGKSNPANGTWSPTTDDQHIRNIVEQVEGAVGKQNIKAFWLAGHSFGGQTSNRFIMTDPFFTERVDGWVSLSGGRLGSKRADVRATIPNQGPPRAAAAPGAAATPAAGAAPPRAPGAAPPAGGPPGGGGAMIDASILPEKPFSFIYEAGDHEWTHKGVPKESKWAQKLGCGAQPTTPRQVVDTKAGYVYDSSRQGDTANRIWGFLPRPGTANIWEYPGCKDGRVVADITRLDKGHTEGLEPAITEEIVKLMISAKSP